MKLSKKTVLIGTLLAGTVLATATLAEMGPGMGGMDGDEGGPMLLEMFDAIDTDSDGKLSLAELEAHRTAEFTAADTNSDGTLDAQELSAKMLARVQERMADRVQHMIENKDNDGSGGLSADEVGSGPVEDHFARIDADNDGMISKAEAEAALQHHKKHGHGMMGGGEGCDEGEGNN